MQTHGPNTDARFVQNATTATRKAYTFAELRMAIEDKARAQRIAELRKLKRLTQEAAAQKVDVHYRTYQTWESQKNPVMPEWPHLERLATVLGVKPEDIIGETPDLAALMGVETGQSQLDRMEAELAAIRVEIGTLATLQAETLRLLAPTRGTGASESRTRKAK